jgi:phage-related protein
MKNSFFNTLLEVFSKKTQTTPREIEEVCRRRLRQYEAI